MSKSKELQLIEKEHKEKKRKIKKAYRKAYVKPKKKQVRRKHRYECEFDDYGSTPFIL